MKLKKPSLACINTACSFCLALISFIHFSKISFVFFGEPKFPNPKDYE